MAIKDTQAVKEARLEKHHFARSVTFPTHDTLRKHCGVVSVNTCVVLGRDGTGRDLTKHTDRSMEWRLANKNAIVVKSVPKHVFSAKRI